MWLSRRVRLKPLERVAEDKFTKFAAVNGCLALKLEIQGNRNYPDRMILMPDKAGVVFFIEFKREGEEPRKGQKFRIKKLRDMGYKVYVCSTYNCAESALVWELGR